MGGVGFVEVGEVRAVEVEDAEELAVLHQGEHDLGAGGVVAGDVAGECFHIGHEDRLAARRGGATDPAAHRDADAGDLALERAEHELAPA